MVWCTNCSKNISQPDNVDGKICCNVCGRVVDEDNFSQDPTFVKNAAGQSQLSGNLVRTVPGRFTASRERTLNEAYDGISSIMYAMEIDGGDSIATPAVRFYEVAVNKNFTKGRRKEQVQAACLYICCRVKNKPYLLIDFSEYLRINVYVLGAVFLQLSKILSLQEHPTFLKPVDPSLFIHRFTECLFNGRIPSPSVSKTALHIVASMKRDWMQTGRKPSGLCGAALYISALSHGLKCSKSEIFMHLLAGSGYHSKQYCIAGQTNDSLAVTQAIFHHIRVVHICEATLTKRLIEFENTDSGGLTIEEFTKKAEELAEEEKEQMESLDTRPESSGISKLLCVHKDSEETPFAHGLCKHCYDEFIKISGGFNGGSDPPAFQRAERERIMVMEATADSSENLDSSTLLGLENNSELLNCDEQRSINNMSKYKATQPADTVPTGSMQSKVTDESSDGWIPADAPLEESESLSDIDDTEVEVYLHSEEEKILKKICWEEMNKEYLEEQAAKEAAEIAAKKAYEANFSNCSEDVKAAQKLAAAAAEAVANSKKEKQQKRAADMKNAGPPQTAAEATKRMLDKKKLSSKIRYDVLEKLFDESEQENPESIKRIRTEAKSDCEDNYFNNNKEDGPEFEGNDDGPEFDGFEDPYINHIETYDYRDDYNQYDGF